MEPAGEKHDRFTQWAKERGVKINGVAPARFPGRGLGIAAKKDIKVQIALQHSVRSGLILT